MRGQLSNFPVVNLVDAAAAAAAAAAANIPRNLESTEWATRANGKHQGPSDEVVEACWVLQTVAKESD